MQPLKEQLEILRKINQISFQELDAKSDSALISVPQKLSFS